MKFKFPVSKYWYYYLPLLLGLLQFFYTLNSMSQIRYEEAANSIRNVFWLQQGYIYDGVSTSMGWYLLLLWAYNLFGFSIFTAKLVRIFLHLVALFSLAGLLRKYFPEKYAWLPLVVIGLSPTILFYNTVISDYGLEFDYLPIILYLLSTLKFEFSRRQIVLHGLFLALNMFAWMSRPNFVFLFPLTLGWYAYKFWTTKPIKWSNLAKWTIVDTFGFLAPLLALYAGIKNRQLLIYDDRIHSGLFRGGNGVLNFDPTLALANFDSLIGDLFDRTTQYSYNFEVAKVEFSDLYPLLAILLIIGISIILLKNKKYFWAILAAVVIIAVNLYTMLFIQDGQTLPGIRRSTGVLVSIYLLFIIGWHYLSNYSWKQESSRLIVSGILGLFLIHHLIAYPLNFAHLTTPSPYRLPEWFTVDQTPTLSIDQFVFQAQQHEVKLACSDPSSQCRYSEIYPAIAGACTWNHLKCHPVLGWDASTQSYLPLNPQLWLDYYFDH